MHLARHLALLTLIFTASAVAGSDTPPTTPASFPDKPLFSGEFGLTLASQYNARGIIVQDRGVSFQPYLNLHAHFFDGQGFVQSSSFFLGLWSDVSSNGDVSGPENDGSRFTEFDFGLGLSVNFAERWSFTTFYNQWTSPADAYGDGHWINATLSFDDTGLLHENFSLRPSLLVLRDLGGDQPAGLVRNSWYVEPGIRPNCTFFRGSQLPLNVALLVKAGLGNEFYGGETFGYLATGPQLSAPLKFIDPSAGKWSVSAGYLFYRFGDTLEVLNGARDEHLFTFSLAIGF